MSDYCQFAFEEDGDRFLRATCQACGRSVRVKSRRAKAACKASARYSATHAEMMLGAAASHPATMQPMADAGGPGTELSVLLGRLGIHSSPTCSCRAIAAKMNRWGPDGCEMPERIEEVLAVMRDEARRRGLPWIDAAGRLLVRRAIRNARKRLPTPSGQA